MLRRDAFDLPEGVIYLDGNSLGPLPRGAKAAVARAMQAEWGAMLIRGWNEAGWMDQPDRLGDRIAPLIGAAPGTVTVGETLSIRVFQGLAAALSLRPGRKVILTEAGNFPSDLYMAQGLIDALGQGHVLRALPATEIPAALTDEVAVLMLTEVDYRSGARHDMAALTAQAHGVGALTLWDLAHSAGALPVALTRCNADFAAGCTYKYLNGGPGAPAFFYARPDHSEITRPILAGWLGHAAPFDFAPDYAPGPGRARFRIGTPPVLQMAALDAALDIFDGVDIAALHARAIALADRLATGFEAVCPDLRRLTPMDPARRGSQIAFAHPNGYAMVQALIAQGVIGDFRAPDILRFGLTPLYLDAGDIDTAIERFPQVIEGRLWDDPAYRSRNKVT
ncbi:kynureninase [Dinoroseobacter sp. PD6]|uniref:kynureninase n=1 Tax=Dinoroseobacter sp. PD6 TaxID=3028384 RepID=UPI00237A7E23|nr:kynureninase [Dinoroseobacter sp. PD6]MDD9716073.1 kynureninase [Dinoroseobacter sp. PD6]